VTIACNYNGYTKAPLHLTFKSVRNQLSAPKDYLRENRRANITIENKDELPVNLIVDELILVEAGDERKTRYEVIGLIQPGEVPS
jgi:hypothetical protein